MRKKPVRGNLGRRVSQPLWALVQRPGLKGGFPDERMWGRNRQASFFCQMLPGYSTFPLLDLIFLHVLLLAAGSLNISLPEEVSIIGLECFYFRHFWEQSSENRQERWTNKLLSKEVDDRKLMCFMDLQEPPALESRRPGGSSRALYSGWLIVCQDQPCGFHILVITCWCW